MRHLLLRGLRKITRALEAPASDAHSKLLSENPIYAGLIVGTQSYGWPEIRHFDEHDSLVRIGKYSSIAEGSVILRGGEHRTDAVSTYPFKQLLPGAESAPDTSFSRGDVEIGSDVWIGYRAMIRSGVKIGHGAVVATGALVTRDVPPYAIVGGVPAKIIRFRFPPEQISALLAIAWWDWPAGKIIEAANSLSSNRIEDFIRQYDVAKDRR